MSEAKGWNKGDAAIVKKTGKAIKVISVSETFCPPIFGDDDGIYMPEELERPAVKVVVVISGGAVQSVYASKGVALDVTIADYDEYESLGLGLTERGKAAKEAIKGLAFVSKWGLDNPTKKPQIV
jgi:hypothetical protein